jgi:light-regulated signal transduction histidine kinase (bacteriophytochrome)
MDALGKIGEGLFIVDRAYKVLYMNEAMTRWFGDQTGKTCYASVANLDGQCEYCQLEEVIGEGKTVRYQPTTPDGRTFDIVAVPFLEPGGTVAKLEVVRDITEKKEAERHLHELVDSLARTVGELERFGFIAAHDLQEPLRHIVINTQLLERELGAGISDPVRQHIGTVVESARRMRALVNDLLQYSRVNAESAPFRPFRVSDAVTAATKHLGEAIDAAQARIAVGELPEVVGDQGQITSVFTHLLSNALKFRHPDRTPDITISATRTDERWTFSVRDNGIGIERPYTERVFEVFRRLHTIERYPGTGIGLAVVRRIIERHGGRIWVESEPDTGSTFHFSLPVGEHGGGMPTPQSDTLE